MKSLVHLCHDAGIPKRQREFFCSTVITLLSEDGSPREIAINCLRNLWIRYDSGGISVGRSLRAALLEAILSEVMEGFLGEKARLRFSLLLGMYHDHTFINAQGWYDYQIEHFHESDVLHRVWLSVAAFCLHIDEVVEMSDWPIEKIKVLLFQES